MKISIALCTYNGENFLREQLESIAAQTRKPDEIVVCDDCSQDTTIEIVRDFAENAAFAVRLYVNEQNLRSTKNFERAISLCTGDLIFLSDQDDVWHESKLEKFAAEFERNENVNLVFCDAELVDENLKPLGKTSWNALQFDAKQQNAVNEGRGAAVLLNRNVVSGCMTAFRARYKNLVLPIPDDVRYVIHDFWIVLLMLTVGDVKVIAETLVKYRQHDSQQIGLDSGETEKNVHEKLLMTHDFEQVESTFEKLKAKLQERFAAKNDEFPIKPQKLMMELNSQIRHAQTRANIKRNNRGRILLISKELLARRYHRHSNGFKSAAKDLSLCFSR